MALELAIETPFKLKANYWRITDIHLDYNSNKAKVFLDGYNNKKQRDEDGMAIGKLTLEIDGANFKNIVDIREDAYKALKNNKEDEEENDNSQEVDFSNAKDLL